MTERRGLLKWVAYTVAFFLVYFFSAGVFPRFPVYGAVPNMIPVMVAFFAIWEGSLPGSVYGLCLGLFQCLAQNGDGASLILLGAVVGMLFGLVDGKKLRHRLVVSMLCALGALLLVETVQVLGIWLFGSASLSTLLRIAGAELVYSLVLALPVYPLFRFAARQFDERYYGKPY